MARDVAALLLRVVAGLIFLPHGWSKVMGEGGSAAFAADIAASYNIPAFLGHLAAWAELAGAILLIAGLFTRVDAFLLAATMFVAAFVVALPDAMFGAPPNAIRAFVAIRGIETPLAMFAICLALLLVGGGRFSLDHLLAGLLGKKKAAAEAAAVRV
ncbi:MAG TPA: DoxX family protein [Thermoanaerobaculia bacterium]|nr:DoxX family protein [Thermoanaerobaculia bacterium]